MRVLWLARCLGKPHIEIGDKGGQQIPEEDPAVPWKEKKSKIAVFLILNWLHHDYRLAV